MKRSKRHIVALALFVAAIVIASIALQDAFDGLSSFLDRYSGERAFIGSFIFVALAALSVLLGPFTSAPLTPFAVGLWGAETTIALLMVGWLVGNTVAYAIGYYAGHPLMQRVVSKERFNRSTSFVSKRTATVSGILKRAICMGIAVEP